MLPVLRPGLGRPIGVDLERSKLRRVLPRRSWLIQLGEPASLMDDLIDKIIAAAAKRATGHLL